MFVFYNCDTHFPGGGVKALFTMCLTHIFHEDSVCLCVCFEANKLVKIYLGVLCFVYMYSVCICAVSDFVFKSDCVWFYVCKAAPRMWIFFFAVVFPDVIQTGFHVQTTA